MNENKNKKQIAFILTHETSDMLSFIDKRSVRPFVCECGEKEMISTSLLCVDNITTMIHIPHTHKTEVIVNQKFH